MYLGFAPHWARVMIGGWGALSTVDASLLAPAADEPAPGIGRSVRTGRPPKAVPSVLMNTTRRPDIVTPAGSRSDIRTHLAVSVQSGSVEWRSEWNSGEPGSGPSDDVPSVIRTALVNGLASPVADAMSAERGRVAVPV